MSYKAQIDVLGKKYEAKGKTATEAIRNLDPQGMARGKSILVVSHGDKTKEKVLPPNLVNRLFNLSPTVRDYTLKYVGLQFDL